VAFVLEPKGAPGPPGARFDETIADEVLYRIPGAAAATLAPEPRAGPSPVNASGGAVSVSYPGPAEWSVVTKTTVPELLQLRLSDVPGWGASIDGKPLRLERFAGIMLEARIPPGSHVVELRYWPGSFTVGLVCAGAGAVGLAVAVVLGWGRRRRTT
jgi:hypothetical protein